MMKSRKFGGTEIRLRIEQKSVRFLHTCFFLCYREGRYHQLYVKEFILHKLGEIYFNLMNAYFFMIQIEQGFKHT